MEWTRGHIIGRGSSATVSAATSGRSGDTLAVKSVELLSSEFLQREQRILSSFSSCPQIVSYKGCDITSENNTLMFNLLMEYIPSGTLTDAVHENRGGLEESVIRHYTRQILIGLEYIHSCGIAHCDIKGSNILIGEHGAKIADFGCAKVLEQVAVGGGARAAIGGTPVFMSPEVARGEEQGFPADIWALGCTIIEMATGGSPWPNLKNPVAALYTIGFSGELPKIPSFLSIQAKDFLGNCLRREAKERWTAKELLNHPFIGQINSKGKQIQAYDSTSPTSILDQELWNSIGESETDLVRSSSSDSPAKRIGRLSLFSRVSSKTGDENWITIRSC